MKRGVIGIRDRAGTRAADSSQLLRVGRRAGACRVPADANLLEAFPGDHAQARCLQPVSNLDYADLHGSELMSAS